MTRARVVVGRTAFLVAPDDAPPEGARWWALVQARLLDDVSGDPVTRPADVTPAGLAFRAPRTRALVRPRRADGGVVGLVGVPHTVFPDLRNSAYDVGLTVRADGYLPATATRSLAAQPTFPDTFTPAQLGDVEMHAEPVSLCGRAMYRDPATHRELAAAFATVRITAAWRRASDPTATPVVPPVDIVTLVEPLQRAYAANTTIDAITFTMAGTPYRAAAARTGDGRLRLDSVTGLSTTSTVVVEPGHPQREELVQLVDRTSSPEPVATLHTPLLYDHPADAVVRRVNRGVAASTTLAAAAIPGDVTLLVADAALASSAGRVALPDGPHSELRRVQPLAVGCNDEGYFRLPALARVALVALVGKRGTAAASDPMTILIDYAAREQRVDLAVP